MKIIPNLKFQTSHTTFSIVFTVLMFVICNLINIDKIAMWFQQGDSIDYAALIAYLIFGYCLFLIMFIFLAHRWTIKFLSILLVISSATATYFIAKYNVAIERTMLLNTINTDMTEVGALLSIHMIPYIILLIVIPVFIIIRTDISFHGPAKHVLSSVKVGVLAFIIGTVALYAQYNGIYRAGNISKKYVVHSLVPLNYMVSLFSQAYKTIQPLYARSKEAVKITGHVTTPDDLVVVLAIGETSRQKSFSLYGYERRDTNPVLTKTKGLHILNGIAGVGVTLYALPEILEKNEIKLPTIVSKLGVDTACLVNYTFYDNCQAVGEIAVANCKHGDKCYDEDVVPLLEENLKSYRSGYRFVVLHLGGGSHGPLYNDRIPPEYKHFKPTCDDADVINQCTKEELYNSYDNTILYVDFVVGNIIRKLDNSGAPYVFIYLSDHGESLLENGNIFHGMPPGIGLPPEQKQVPLIVKSSVPISIVKRDEYLQQDIFDTVLDLFTIETDLFSKERTFIKRQDENARATETAIINNTGPVN